MWRFKWNVGENIFYEQIYRSEELYEGFWHINGQRNRKKVCMTFRKDTELIHFHNISNYKYSLEYYLITDKE